MLFYLGVDALRKSFEVRTVGSFGCPRLLSQIIGLNLYINYHSHLAPGLQSADIVSWLLGRLGRGFVGTGT